MDELDKVYIWHIITLAKIKNRLRSLKRKGWEICLEVTEHF